MQIGGAVISTVFFIGSLLMFVTGLCTLVAFASPYWSQSYPSTGNNFKNIGLWEVCFYRFRHWKDDDQKPYTGCFWFWSPDMIKFRDWIMPYWFIAVQFFACFGFIFTFVTLAFLSVSFVTLLRFKIKFMLSMVILSICSCLFLFLALLIYGINGDNREWMPRPEFNVYSFSYWFELSACFFSSLATTCFLVELKALIRARNRQLRKNRKNVNNTAGINDDDDDDHEVYIQLRKQNLLAKREDPGYK